MKSDYLKYWRVVRQYAKVKYGLTQPDMDFLFFLRHEQYFGGNRTKEFQDILGWDKNRWQRLMREGWIEKFRQGKNFKYETIWTLSFKAKNVVDEIYSIIEGKEIPVKKMENTIYKRKEGFNDKVYRNLIKSLREEVRERQQRPSLE